MHADWSQLQQFPSPGGCAALATGRAAGSSRLAAARTSLQTIPSSTPEQNPHEPSVEEKPFDPLDFPPGLIQKQRTLAAAYADLHRFSANPDLTWSLETHEGWDDSRSGRWRVWTITYSALSGIL